MLKKWASRALVAILSMTLVGMILGMISLLAFTGWALTLPRDVENQIILNVKSDRTTRLYYTDQGGNELEWVDNRISGYENALYCPISEIPAHLQNAFIAIEDKRFYDHGGVDWYRTLAAVKGYFAGDSSFGGSTITQQLVKNLTGDSEKSARRKMGELMRAARLERRMSKEEILEAYLNVVNLSENCYGVKTAANAYFSKEPSELTLCEAACIAAITNNPARYDPILHPEENRKRRDLILTEMHEQGMIEKRSFEEAIKSDTKLRINRESMSGRINSWYADMVTSDVIESLITEKGMTRAEASRLVYCGGLKIYTMVAPSLQEIVEEYYADITHFPKTSDGKQVESAMMLVDPHSGAILAVAGAVGPKSSNRVQSFATDTKRPSGSVIKPLSVYAPALQKNLITYATVFDDVPLQYRKNGAPWPRNAPNLYRGLVNVNEALTHSVNTVSVSVLKRLGHRASFDFLSKELGFRTLDAEMDIGAAALALGQQSTGVSLRELLGGYTVLAGNGTYRGLRSFYRVEDSFGSVLLARDGEERLVLDGATTSIMTMMLRHVMREGTAKESVLKKIVDVAGKTGTSSNNCDKWFVGYTPELLAGVWCGMDYPESLSSIKGNPSLSVFDAVMEKVVLERGITRTSFENNGDVVAVRYCKDSGKLISEACRYDPRGDRTEIGYFKRGTEPSGFCDCHVLIDYCDHGGIATENCPNATRTKVALLRVKRSFPCQIRVLDAPYTFDGFYEAGGRIATEYEPYYAVRYAPNTHFGIELDLLPYNRICQAHGNPDEFWRRRAFLGA